MTNTLTPVIIDMLTTQYVWTLQNDVGWHNKARAAITRNDPDTFDRVTLGTLAKGTVANNSCGCGTTAPRLTPSTPGSMATSTGVWDDVSRT